MILRAVKNSRVASLVHVNKTEN